MVNHLRASRHAWRASRHQGFTLIELLIVITLIMILAGIAMVQYRNTVILAQEAVLKTDLLRMRDAIDQYYADKGKYPSSLETLVSERYIREVPIDPTTKLRTTWTTEPAAPDPSNPSAGPGIYNVRSGSPGTASDGTRYASW
jgi:general secretion pathway protein G